MSLEFLAEPAFLVRPDGTGIDANEPGRRLLGCGPAGFDLFDFIQAEAEKFRVYLRRASGSSAPIVGAVTLMTPQGPVRFRVNCARLSRGAEAGALVFRCLSPRDDRFASLQRKIRDLDAQLRNRMHEKAVLEQALRQNQELLKELQHRVKNNIQLMISLIQMSGRGRQSDEVQALIEAARSRLAAMASAQDAIYRSTATGHVAMAPLLTELTGAVCESFGVSANLRLDIADIDLSSDLAHGLALIVNELTTNAIKHGLSGGGEVVQVSLRPKDDGLELVVFDDGPGIEPAGATRPSGLRLVRALCRQIGGTLDITAENGTRCAVGFKSDRNGGSA